MRVLYIHQYFNTPETGGPLRSYYLSKALVNAGIEVELVTTHNSIKYALKDVEGIKVHFLPIPYKNSFSYRKRIFSFLRFVFQAIVITRKVKADICYTTSTPLTVGLIALWLRYYKKLPFVFEVRDLWPEAPIQIGAIKNSLLKKALFTFEKLIYIKSKAVVTLSPEIKKEIQKKAPGKEVAVLTNMSDTGFFQSSGYNNALVKEEYNAVDKVVITYFGAAGKANNLTSIIDAAKWLSDKKKKEFLFVIAAKGNKLKDIQETAEQKGLDNIKFVSYLNRNKLKDLLAITDFTYLSFLDLPVLKTSSPNKLFDSLAAGVPVISNINGWWVESLEESQAGFYYNPKNPESLYSILNKFSDRSLLQNYKSNARKLAEDKFSRDKICKDYIKILSDLTKKS